MHDAGDVLHSPQKLQPGLVISIDIEVELEAIIGTLTKMGINLLLGIARKSNIPIPNADLHFWVDELSKPGEELISPFGSQPPR